MQWYFSIDSDKQGPVELDELKTLVKDGKLKPTDYVWNQNMGDKWAKVCEIPILGCPMPTSEDPEQKQKIEEQIAARKAMEAKKKTQNIIYGIASVLILSGIIAFTTVWKKNAPYRLYSINSETPIGSLEALDSYFINELQMTKTEVQSIDHFIIPPSAKIFMYDKPGIERGKHISAAGAIFLFVDNDRLRGMLCDFPSPGFRGPSIVNKSLVSIFMKKIWILLGGIENPGGYAKTAPIKDQLMKQFNYNDVPDGHCEILEKEGFEGLWLEYGIHHCSSSVFLKLKD